MPAQSVDWQRNIIVCQKERKKIQTAYRNFVDLAFCKNKFVIFLKKSDFLVCSTYQWRWPPLHHPVQCRHLVDLAALAKDDHGAGAVQSAAAGAAGHLEDEKCADQLCGAFIFHQNCDISELNCELL